MTEAVRRLIESFDALPATDKQVALVEILRRISPEGDVPVAGLDALADELFAALDAEEAIRAGR